MVARSSLFAQIRAIREAEDETVHTPAPTTAPITIAPSKKPRPFSSTSLRTLCATTIAETLRDTPSTVPTASSASSASTASSVSSPVESGCSLLPLELKNVLLDTLCSEHTLSDHSLALLCNATTYQLRVTQCKVSNSGLCTIAKLCPNLESLQVSECINCTLEGIMTVVESCRQLQVLDLSWQKLTDDDLFKLLPLLPPTVVFLGLRGRGLTNDVIPLIVQHCPQLKMLELSWQKHITVEGIQHLRALTLHHLAVGWMPALNAECLEHVVETSGPSLTFLNLENSRLIMDDEIKYLAANCPRLENLKLKNLAELSDDSVVEMAKHCPRLKVLNLAGCQDVSSTALFALAQHCQLLENVIFVGLHHINETGVQALLDNCPFLRHLDVGNCRQISASFTARAAEKCATNKIHDATY